MPNLSIPISDLMSSVERPIIYDVIRQLMVITGIPPTALIRFFGEDAGAMQMNSQTIGALSAQNNLWPHLDKLRIEVEEDFNPDRILSMSVKDEDNNYIFVDRALNVLLKPAYSSTNVVIRITYEGVDRNEASRWRNDVRTRLAMGRETNIHDINYSYELPAALEALLIHIFDLRENAAIAPYGETIGQWWAKCASSKFTVSTTQAGTHATIMLAERQAFVQGFFDWPDEIPEKASKSTDADMWEVVFSYKFTYEKPIAVVAKYPLLIHQQFIGDVFRQYNNYKPQEDILKELSLSGTFFNRFQGDQDLIKRLANKGVTIPIEDDWQPLRGTIPSYTLKIFTGLVGISATDKRMLMDLKDLGDFQLVKALKDFIAASEYAHMTEHAGSILQLTLYEGYQVLSPEDFEVTADLIVQATRDLDLRKMYHLRLSIYANILGLQASAVQRVRNNHDVAVLLAKAINASLTESGRDPDLKKNALNAYDLGLLGLDGGQIPPTYSYSLFQTLFIDANRMDQYQPPAPNPVAINHPQVFI
jgi:hypothetical protein